MVLYETVVKGVVIMPKKSWTFEVDGVSHMVELEHGSIFGGKQIRIDGVELDRKLLKRKSWLQPFGSEDYFEVGGHPAVAYISSNGFSFKHDLTVDGISVVTGKTVQPPLPAPVWGWPFVILNFGIVFLGGALPVMVGFLGTAGCIKVLRSPNHNALIRSLSALGVTILSWVAVFGLSFLAHWVINGFR